MKLAEVHTLYEANCRSIPAMLRQAADNLEADPDCTAKAMVAVQLDDDGNVQVYGWGDTDVIQAAGLLHMGLLQVARIQLDGGE
jgi:hypothetical protein